MTRLSFASLLRGELRGLNGGEIEKSVQFYDELICDHMDDGMTEEEAVLAVGTPAEIAGEILMDQPVSALVRRRVKRRARFRGLAAVLIVLGSPVWLPLSIAAVILIVVFVLLAYLFVFLVALVLWVAVLSVAVSALAAVLNVTFSASGLLYAGVALAGAGLTVVLAIGVTGATKGCIAAWHGMSRGIKRLALGRRNRDDK